MQLSDRWRTALLAAILIAYFLCFNLSSLAIHFAADDPMNLDYAWKLPTTQLVLAPFMPWKAFYRPVAGWLMVPTLHFFGLNPAPFHVAILVFVLGIALLLWRLARLLGCGEWASWIAAILVCYQPGLSNLYYSINFVYDALCGFFFLAALVYYVRIRQKGLSPTRLQIAAFLGLFLLALDSKEMAVSLPVVILLYEWFYHGPMWRNFGVWMRGPGLAVLAGGALDLVYVYGRVFGTGGTAASAGYIPKFTAERFWDFQIRSFSDMVGTWNYFDRFHVAMLWALLLFLAWRRPRPVLRFACLYLLITPLPIEFLIGRSGACLVIPFAALAMFVAVVFGDLVSALTRFLTAEPLFRRVPREWLAASLAAIGLVLWVHRSYRLKHDIVDPATTNVSPETWNAIQQLNKLRPRVRPSGTVVFLNAPIEGFDMAFIAELWFRDPTVTVRLSRVTPMTDDEIAKADCVLDYKDGNLVEVARAAK